MMNVTYFYRDHRAGNFSIEELFKNIRSGLEGKIIQSSYHYQAAGGRVKGILDARKYQGEINHITGDINFLALGLDANKTIITVHDLGYFENLQNKKIKQFLYKTFWLDLPFKKSRFITTVSNYTKSKIIEYFNIEESKIRVIHNPKNDLFTFSPKVFNEKEPRILAIGTGEHKNFKRLIEAAKDRPCTLVFVSNLNEDIINLLTKYKIKFESYFNISIDKVVSLYKSSDILFFASLHEGFGMPIIEANATGLPVITSNIASMPEVAGNAALIVNPLDIAEIRNALNKIIEEPETRIRLIENGISNCKRFELDKICNEYLNLYRQVAIQ